MYDESWCASCGAGMHYTEDEDAKCGECASEQAQDVSTRSSKFMEYMKIHLISLHQDLEDEQYLFRTNRDNHDTSKINDLMGQIQATRHLLSVVHDILGETNNEGEK